MPACADHALVKKDQAAFRGSWYKVAPRDVRAEVTMIALEEQILSLLKKAPEQLMSFRQLIRELDLDDSERHEIRQILHEMVKSGNVIKLKGNRFSLPEERSVISGKLSAHRDGYGFVTPDKKASGFAG